MRVYISVDMEGVAGIVHEDQTNPVEPRAPSTCWSMIVNGGPSRLSPAVRESSTCVHEVRGLKDSQGPKPTRSSHEESHDGGALVGARAPYACVRAVAADPADLLPRHGSLGVPGAP
jgi:hypothetical protein